MPKSRRRKKDDSTTRKRDDSMTQEPSDRRDPTVSARWVVPTMVSTLVLGLVWIVAYYLLRDNIAFMDALGGWNLVIGMGLITAGFVTATQWK